MRHLENFGISAWSWLSPASEGSWQAPSEPSSDETARDRPAPWENSGLSPHAAGLALPGFWGRVDSKLPTLPDDLTELDSRCAELLVRAAHPLAESVARARSRYGKERVAIILGSSTGGIDATEAALAHEREHGEMPSDYSFEDAHVYHALVRVLRGLFDLQGPGYVISTACSSAGKALAAGQRLLATGAADAVVSGGVDALCEMTLRGFGGLGILSPERCRPFDAARNGISIGEGAALLLLERDTTSHYFLLGAGESSDAHHQTAPHPEGLGARLAIERALEVAGLSPVDVDYVNAHGTGTVQNDLAESRAITAMLDATPFSSTKDRTGHQLGTAAATEAVICLEALRRGELPPNRPVDNRDDELAAQPYEGNSSSAANGSSKTSSAPRTTLSNSFAFGGSNVCVALGRREGPSQHRLSPSPHKLYVTGLAGWASQYPNIEALLAGTPADEEARPPARILPARARGRASTLTRIYAELYGQLWGNSDAPRFDAQDVGMIFGSAYGEMTTTLRLLEQLQTEPTLSPARFQASVHNTAAGLISIATKNRSYSTAVAAGDATVAMSLLDAEAWLKAHGGQALVLIADEQGPAHLLRGTTFPPLGLGLHLVIASAPPKDALACLGTPRISAGATSPRDSLGFEGAPAAWGLALMQALLKRESGAIRLGYRWQLDVDCL